MRIPWRTCVICGYFFQDLSGRNAPNTEVVCDDCLQVGGEEGEANDAPPPSPPPAKPNPADTKTTRRLTPSLDLKKSPDRGSSDKPRSSL